ncbi:MAG TPA: caspase family protein, partial [Anaerolineae bacterium]|nr:caspase family protein [Anaerolineae bacterium]
MLVGLVVYLLAVHAPALGQDYSEGDQLVVLRDTQLKIEDRTVATVRQGSVLVVERVGRDWLWVRYGQTRGWIQRHNVSLRRTLPDSAARGGPKPTSLQAMGGTFNRTKRWALIIAINKYLDPKIPSLRYCVADAQLLADTLIEHCGYEPKRILMLTDAEEADHLKPLGINLRNQVLEWLKRPDPGDTMLVFFAGHGLRDDEGHGYLAPKDCEFDKVGLTAVSISHLRDLLNQCKATQKVLILDCCHAGGERNPKPVGPSSHELGLAFVRASGLVTLASCAQQEFSLEWDEQKHGLFTYWLVQGLRGRADYDRNRLVDVYELHRYTLEQVSLTAQKRLNGRQTPKLLLAAEATGVFALASVGDRPVPQLEPTPTETAPAPLTVNVDGVDAWVVLKQTNEDEDSGTVTVKGTGTVRDVYVRKGQSVKIELN